MWSTRWGGGMKRQAGLLCMGFALLTAGCQAAVQQAVCPLPGQARMISIKLYFGRDIQGGGFVDDAQWAGFAAQMLTPAFPDGFTEYAAVGQWRDPRDGRIVREKSFVVESVGTVVPAKLDAVVRAYRAEFKQQAVGMVTEGVCAVF